MTKEIAHALGKAPVLTSVRGYLSSIGFRYYWLDRDYLQTIGENSNLKEIVCLEMPEEDIEKFRAIKNRSKRISKHIAKLLKYEKVGESR